MAKREYQFTYLKQTNPDGLFYNDDPIWLAYNKVGACRELSTLFSFMANQAGIKSRTVQTGIWHQWAEVKIDGEWMYYDPWCVVYHNYYNRSDGNMTFRGKWFNKIEYFEENCHPIAIVDSYNEFPYIWATQVYGSPYFNHEMKKIVNYSFTN